MGEDGYSQGLQRSEGECRRVRLRRTEKTYGKDVWKGVLTRKRVDKKLEHGGKEGKGSR